MDSGESQTGTQGSPTAPTHHQFAVTPGGTKYWIPECDESDKPYNGQRFRELHEAIDFHKRYALIVGFDVRHSTLIKSRDKTILWKYMVCSREGYKHHTAINTTDGHTEFVIKDADGNTFSVVHEIILNTTTCSCKHFVLYGWLCRHVFVVLKDLNMQSIPSAHILSRWTKTATINPMFHVLDVAFAQCVQVDDKKLLLSKLWSDIHACMGLVEPCVNRLAEFSKVIEAHKVKLLSDQGENATASNKEQQFESFVGMAAPQEVTIHPPTHSKNKGSGKRLKSAKEKAIEQSQKKRRVCKSCGERVGHNARTCPKKT
ncbi:Protein FAR1-RELATED SEQUENCE 1 [Striga hermonthica]|uniref:Protein FAR1-RELATED SEQUENCE 1 n=2 Tax=Striga hermonthica TaxID=68872 RepID=A0A9N7N851_STRHE|nr:Protein FAR1-RELATED SEQUENCE 1 [Striga hermonthica]